MNTEIKQAEQNSNDRLNELKIKSKIEALRFAPSRKPSNYSQHGIYEVSMTSKEIVAAADEIYQWLIKE